MKEILKHSSELLTPIIAIITTYIAYQQHKTNKNNYKWSLYDRRYETYEALLKLISHVVLEGTAEIKEIAIYTSAVNKSYFLFQPEMNEYLFQIRDKAFELYQIKIKQNENILSKEERTETANKWANLIQWMEKQTNECKHKFEFYLRLEN